MCGSVQVINFNSGKVGHGQNEFTNRVGFSAAMPSANLSIYINNTQESDSGRYICSVIFSGGTSPHPGELRLNVKGNGPVSVTSILKVTFGKLIKERHPTHCSLLHIGHIFLKFI